MLLAETSFHHESVHTASVILHPLGDVKSFASGLTVEPATTKGWEGNGAYFHGSLIRLRLRPYQESLSSSPLARILVLHVAAAYRTK